jgi:ZIP family zinc transporter
VVDVRPFAIGVLAGVATVGGGVLALRVRSRLNLLAALGGGVLLAVSLGDLLPEAVTLGRGAFSAVRITSVTLAGFLFYFTLDRVRERLHGSRLAVALAPASLVLHSVLDGVGMGAAFSVSSTVGLTVAAAVLAHDLLDGANTVTLSLAGDPLVRRARLWLSLDAAAPLVGICVSGLTTASSASLALCLAFFAGLLLHIAVVELLPRGREGGRGWLSGLCTLLGAGVMLWLIEAAG